MKGKNEGRCSQILIVQDCIHLCSNKNKNFVCSICRMLARDNKLDTWFTKAIFVALKKWNGNVSRNQRHNYTLVLHTLFVTQNLPSTIVLIAFATDEFFNFLVAGKQPRLK